jgi:hypothetical protein
MARLRSTALSLAFAILAFPFPAAPQLPELNWHKDVKPSAEKAEALSSSDPTVSFLMFRELYEGRTKKPTADQKAWLEQRMAVLKPKALAVLRQDFEVASQALDYRGMIIAADVAERVERASIHETVLGLLWDRYFSLPPLISEPALTSMKKKIVSGAEGAPQLWKVTNATATPLKGAYNTYSPVSGPLVPQKGFRLLRVRARVENIGSGSDKSYTLWALHGVKRLLSVISKTTEPHRWLDTTFLYLVALDGELWPCVYASGDLGSIQAGGSGGQAIVGPPRAIVNGSGMDVDVFFSVPEGVQEFRLLVLGSAPVALTQTP